MRLGVIDVGSNTVHLLVVDAHPGARPIPTASHKAVLRLMRYLEPDGAISDEGVAAILDAVPEGRRLLVTNHDALGYFARHYGWRILGSVLPSSSTLAEASPAQLERLAGAIEAAGVPAIFTEQLETTDEASALADRLGVRVVTLYTDSLGDADSGVTT